MSRESLLDNFIAPAYEANCRLFSPFAEQLFQSLDLQKATTSKPLQFKTKRTCNQQLKTEVFAWQGSTYWVGTHGRPFPLLRQSISRQKITQVTDPALVEMMIRYHANDQRTKISLERPPEQSAAPGTLRTRTFDCRNPNKSHSERQFVRQFRVLCLSQPLLYLHEQCLREPETLLQQLDSISTQQIFQYGSKYQQYYCRQPQLTGNPLWFSNLAFNTLGEWLCDSLQRTILEGYHNRAQEVLSSHRHTLAYGREILDFYERLDVSQKQTILTDQVKTLLREDAKLSIVLELLPSSITLPVLSTLSHHIGLLEDLYNFERSKLLVIDVEEKRPRKKPSHNRKKKKTAGSSNSSKTQASSDKFSQSNADRQEEDQKFEGADGEKEPVQTSSSSSEEFVVVQEADNISLRNQESAPFSCGSFEAEQLPKEVEREENEDCIKEALEQPESTNVKGKQPEIEEGNSSESPDRGSQEQTLSESTEEVAEETNPQKKKRSKRKKKIPEELVESLFNMFLDSNLLRFVDGLSIESNSLLEARLVVFERIRFFVMKLYGEYTVDAKLFGSNAAGLALPTSDIDILMTGFSLDTQEESVSLLNDLSSQLRRMRWVVNCETYLHAKVPIIKLEINPCIGFLEMTVANDSIPGLREIKEPLELKNKIESLIKVDITVEAKKAQYSHLGCMSTEFMKGWLEAIPNLNPIMIVLKYLMSQKGLNKPFKGGLSSYCLMIMVTAYLKESIQHYKLAGKPQKSIGEQFIEVLNFYCEEFESENTSLSLLSNQGCFFKTGDEKYSLNIIDPLNYRLMTANCSEYPRIKREFRRIRDSLLSLPELIVADLQQMPASDIKAMLLKKKNAEKWIKRYEQIEHLQIGSIIRGQ